MSRFLILQHKQAPVYHMEGFKLLAPSLSGETIYDGIILSALDDFEQV